MTSHTRRVLELGVGLGLALTLVLTALADWHQRTAARVRADTIRLHILANSDTWDDQLLKLQVRDAVLAAIPEAVTRADTPQQAAAALQTALPALQNAADNALHRAHSAQPARLRLEQFAFAARDYGSFAPVSYTHLDVYKRQVLTIDWYLAHPDWMAHVTSGDYQKYYEQMYKNK